MGRGEADRAGVLPTDGVEGGVPRAPTTGEMVCPTLGGIEGKDGTCGYCEASGNIIFIGWDGCLGKRSVGSSKLSDNSTA